MVMQRTLANVAALTEEEVARPVVDPLYKNGGVDSIPSARAADIAVSLRKLTDTTQNVVKVRRSSDNATADFIASEVTDGTLTTWTGANDGFVDTLYDQSGSGNDITQATTASQPKLVSSGSLITENGLPSMEFDGSNDFLAFSPGLLAGPFSIVAVAKASATGIQHVVGVVPTTQGVDLMNIRFQNSGELFSFLRIDSSTASETHTSSSLSLSMLSLFVDASTLTHTLNNAATESASTTALTLTNFDQSRNVYIGARNEAGSTVYGQIRLSEILVFSESRLSDLSNLQSQVNSAYGIW